MDTISRDTINRDNEISEAILIQAKPKLERALVATFGLEAGLDATTHALTVGWQQRDRLVDMENAAGYLFVVGLNFAKKRMKTRRPVELPPVPEWRAPEVEPGLVPALAELSPQQRAAVLLVHGFNYTYAEAAEVLDVSVSSLRNHLKRGMDKLRKDLGVEQ